MRLLTALAGFMLCAQVFAGQSTNPVLQGDVFSVVSVIYPDVLGEPHPWLGAETPYIAPTVHFDWTFAPGLTDTDLGASFDILSNKSVRLLDFTILRTTGPSSGIELSQSSTIVDYSVIDLGTAATLVAGQLIGADERTLRLSLDLTSLPSTRDALRLLWSLSFVGGNWLAPSPDPECTTIECMVATQQTQSVYAYKLAAQVPEPATIAAMCLGLLMIYLMLPPGPQRIYVPLHARVVFLHLLDQGRLREAEPGHV